MTSHDSSSDVYGPGIGGLICKRCGWAPPTHNSDCLYFEPRAQVAAALASQAARIEAEAHAELRLQFALAVVRSGVRLRTRDCESEAHAVFVIADALAAENARLRKAEGL